MTRPDVSAAATGSPESIVGTPPGLPTGASRPRKPGLPAFAFAGLIAGFLGGGLLNSVGQPFGTPSELLAQVGASPSPAVGAKLAAAIRSARYHNTAVGLALFGAPVAGLLGGVAGLARKPGGAALGAVAGVALGAAFGGAGGYTQAFIAAQLGALRNWDETFIAIAVQIAGWAVTAVGVGLAVTVGAGTSRLVGRAVAAGLGAAVIAGLLYVPLAALLFPGENSDALIPEQTASSLFWAVLSALVLGLVFGRAFGRTETVL